MNSFKFELNRAGVRALLKSEEVHKVCRQHAEAAYSQVAAIEGYVMEDRHYPKRNGVAIYARDYPAIADNLKNNTLLKVVKV